MQLACFCAQLQRIIDIIVTSIYIYIYIHNEREREREFLFAYVYFYKAKNLLLIYSFVEEMCCWFDVTFNYY